MIYFKNHILDPDRRELRRGTTLIPVEPQVFDLILYLVRNRDRVVTKDDLIKAVWGGRIVSESALTTRINAARTAVGDSGKAQHFIRTLPRKGVRFVGEAQEDPADLAQPSVVLRGQASVVVRAEARAYCVLMGEDEGATRSALHSSRELVVSSLEDRGGGFFQLRRTPSSRFSRTLRRLSRPRPIPAMRLPSSTAICRPRVACIIASGSRAETYTRGKMVPVGEA